MPRVTATADLPHVLAREFTTWTITRPVWIALWVIAGVVAAGVLALSPANRDAMLLIAVGILLVVFTGVTGVIYGFTRSSAASAFPAGSSYGATFDGAVLVLAGAVGRSEVTPTALRRVDIGTHAVFLRLTTARGGVAIMPRNAFLPADLERLRATTRRG